MGIIRGKTFQPNETLSADKLHQLVDEAVVINVTSAQMTSNIRPFFLSSAGRAQYDVVPAVSSGVAQLFYADSAANLFDISGIYPLVNGEGASVVKGDVVELKLNSPGQFQLAREGTSRTIGLVFDTLLSNGATGSVLFKGMMQITVTNLLAVTATPEFFIESDTILSVNGKAKAFLPDQGIAGAENQRAFGQLCGFLAPAEIAYTWVRVIK